jgi:REP element-mobilizing transposase RayT
MKFKSHKQYRLPTRTYAEDGCYFVTVCTRDREHFFGKIEHKAMNYSELGLILKNEIENLESQWQDVHINAFVVMPNHFHLLLTIGNTLLFPKNNKTLWINQEQARFGLQPLIPNSVSSIINHLKGRVTKLCRKIHADFSWQSRFHDHIVRDMDSYNKIYYYILNNPENWGNDIFSKNEL